VFLENPLFPLHRNKQILKSELERNIHSLGPLEKIPQGRNHHDNSLPKLSRVGQSLQEIGHKKVGGNPQTINHFHSINYDEQR
jgi:hypothetical protein